MKFDDLYVVATTSQLPERMTLDEAEKAGLCSARALWRTDIAAVCVAETEPAPVMAAEAARAAVRRAGCRPDEIDLLLYASTSYQGHDMWPAASYVQRVGVGNRCPAIDVSQMSNGGMAAMELAAGYLLADAGRSHVLVTTGDRFCLPGFDRWRSDPGTICGDGAAAAVLSRRPGFARIRSLVTVSDSELERMARGDDPFGAAPFSVRPTIDLEANRRAMVADVGLDAVLERIDAGQRETFDRALSEADTKLADIEFFVVPSLGLGRLKAHFLDPFGIDPDRTSWSLGREIGHLGAGDQIALFGLLADSGVLRPGQRCLLAGVGQGFSWSAAVVEMLHTPTDLAG
ncbi:ketoacyl-ACP synthase III family protein [Micromonospora arborensis]|uniref:ketoacyl-ACP synthase III family protein n=1 Tax=Micromonospora arborensis TaxID=2116518 RepID=UPI0033E35E4F